MKSLLSPFKLYKYNYALYGILFGICFPIIASILKDQPNIMFYIICTAPFFLSGLAYFAGTIQDKTESQVNERTKDLKQANLVANEAIKAKSDFLASMSHELRTPLNGILGITEVFSKENLNSEQVEHLDLINYSGQNLVTLINELLDFSKLKAGKVKINKSRFKINKLINVIDSCFSIQAETKGIKFTINKSKQVPNLMISDETRIFQVLNNIIGNAIKFTHIGHVTVDIDIDESGPTNKLLFTITDTGIGMDEKALNNLFVPYEQGTEDTDRYFGGTGLGVSIVKNILNLINGDIEVQSSTGKGSIFKIQIDYESVKYSDESEDVIQDVPSDKNFKDKYNYSILVTEDNLINQKVIRAFLSKLGYKPDFAINGSEALEALEYKEYDIIFMDIMMPELNGIEATKLIRKQNKHKDSPYIIALTANTSEEDKKECFNVGMNDFIAKPVSLKTIKNVISNAKVG